MRNRYVWQVLSATLGFGILLALIAVVQTPADRLMHEADPSGVTAEAPRCHESDPPAPAPVPKAAPKTDDLENDCDFPRHAI
jgi:hypothetical protein